MLGELAIEILLRVYELNCISGRRIGWYLGPGGVRVSEIARGGSLVLS